MEPLQRNKLELPAMMEATKPIPPCTVSFACTEDLDPHWLALRGPGSDGVPVLEMRSTGLFNGNATGQGYICGE